MRPLLPHYRILYLDGIHFTVRHGNQIDSTIVLTALGVDLEGNREVLALQACAEEDKDGWSCLLQDLRNRGVSEIDLLVSDGHDGLLAAINALFPATPASAVWCINSAMSLMPFLIGSAKRSRRNWQESENRKARRKPCSTWLPLRPNIRSATLLVSAIS